jgi:hypothetical protein
VNRTIGLKRNEKRGKKAAPLHPSVKKRVEKKESLGLIILYAIRLV